MATRQRRAKGSGSVYRVKGRGWVAQRDRPSADGKRHLERRTFATRAEALGQSADWQREAEALNRHPQAGDTVRAWCQHWLNTKTDAVTLKSLAIYARNLGYVMAHIGDVRLYALTPQHIRETLAALVPSDTTPGLAPRSRAYVRNTLRSALRMAVMDGVLDRNPCDAVEAPQAPRYEAYALSDAALAALFMAVEGHRLATFWRFLADLGMRVGELSAAHYDREKATLRIRATKTDRERYLPLTSSHVALLDAQWRALQDERSDNPKWREHGLLFPTGNGTPMAHADVQRTFKAALAKAVLPHRIRIHDLRHTAATNLIAAGVDIATVQYLTGHRTSAVLLEIYSHHHADRNRAAVEKVEEKRKQA